MLCSSYQCVIVNISAAVFPAGNNDDSYFVDAKRSSGNNFVWQTSKEPVQHYNWAPAQPDNKLRVQDCMIIKENVFMFDTACDQRLRAICQYP